MPSDLASISKPLTRHRSYNPLCLSPRRRTSYLLAFVFLWILYLAYTSFSSEPSANRLNHTWLPALSSARKVKHHGKLSGHSAGLPRNKAGLVVLDKLDSEGLERHPIEDLIMDAKLKAQALEDNSLTSLDQAVHQYRQMYNMEPPKGFDLWFSAFPSHVKPKLLRPAHDPIIPFLALKGATIRERLPKMDDLGASFSMNINRGRVSLKGPEADGIRANDLTLLLKPVAHLLPSMDIYFNVDDAPHFIATSDVYQRAMYYGSKGEHWPEEDRAKHEDHQQGGTNGWISACDRDSPAAKLSRDIILSPSEEGGLSITRPKSFIADHFDAMDYCESPELLDSHSLLVFGRPQPAPMLPIFGTCRSKWNNDIAATPLEAINQTVHYIPWVDKTIYKAFWRGKMTGLMASKKLDWRQSQRIRLHNMTNPSRRPSETASVLEQDPNTKRWIVKDRNLLEISKEMFDIGLVDGPLQCVEEDGTCELVKQEIDFAQRVEWGGGVEQQFLYRYTMDVDGNGWSSRFRRTLLSGSVVLKSTVYPEWYSEVLIPWYHYVPVKNSFSDLVDIITFFETRPDLANEIANAGRQFVLDDWQWEDMQSYMILLLLEYARALADDRDLATWKGEGLGTPATRWD